MKDLTAEKIIWATITRSLSVHSAKKIEESDLKPETKILNLFPSHLSDNPYDDEHANRLAVAIMDCFKYFNQTFNK